MLEALAAVAQIALYIGILCASGGVFAAVTLRASGAASQALAALTRCGAILTILATLGGGVVLVYRLGGEFDDTTISAVLMSSVGAAGGMRLAAALLLLPSVDRSDSFSNGMQVSYAALLAASFVFSGHAAAAGVAAGLMAAVHVALAAWWLASLIAMERACAGQSTVDLAALVDRFSRRAVAAVAVLIIAGVVLVATLVGWPIVELTPYLATLGVKLLIVVAVLALATYNKFRLTPRIRTHEAAASLMLRNAIRIELLLIVAILVATTLMTTYNAPEV